MTDDKRPIEDYLPIEAMSSRSSWGYASRICSAVIPSAKLPKRMLTGMRVPLMHGVP